MGYIRILPRYTYDPKLERFSPGAFFYKSSGGISVIDGCCAIAYGGTTCGYINNTKELSKVGTTPKKYHILDDEFVSEFNVKPSPPPDCHYEMFHENQDREREICAEYARNVKLSEIRSCDHNNDRLVTKDDLTKDDIER